MKLKCIIIDNEPFDREVIEASIAETDFLELTGHAENPAEAMALLHSHVVDLIFLDIAILAANGIDFLKNANAASIIITADDAEYMADISSLRVLHCLRKLDVLDYLIKPVSFELFLQVCNKAMKAYKHLQICNQFCR